MQEKPKILRRHVAHKVHAMVDDAVQYVNKKSQGLFVSRLVSHLPMGYGRTHDGIGVQFPLDVDIGANELFQDNYLATMQMGVSAVVSVFHERQHVNQFVNMMSQSCADMRYMSLNHLECHGSSDYMKHNWHKLTTEIDAERSGISNAGAFLSEYFGDDKKADKLLLDYVNSHVGKNIPYFIKPPYGKLKYDNMDDVLDAFDLAYENAKHVHRDYLIPGCMDPNYQFMQDNMTGSARDMLYFEPDGERQSSMMSAIVLYRHPEYKGWHKSLQNMDLSMEAMFGKDWRRLDKPKPVRRLPDVSIETYGSSSQYEP